MSGFLYYLTTALDSGLSVFGVRAPYEQPHYQVIGQLDRGVEIRAYPARMAVETAMDGRHDAQAFSKLFRYITGANRAGTKMPMTIPTEQAPQRIAMTIPVEISGVNTMRFFLPQTVAHSGPPVPTDPAVHVVTLPPADFAVIRFSGTLSETSRADQTALLTHAVAASTWRGHGAASVLSYDPPFAIPFLRRNEIALQVTPGLPE